MEKWYKSLIKEIEEYGTNVFLIDTDNLLEDKNFVRDLSDIYTLHKYDGDGDYFSFTENHKNENILIFSNNDIMRGFLNNKVYLDISLVFPDLDLKILKNMDKSYYQKIFNNYSSLKSKGIDYDTKNLIFRSVWDVDIGQLHDLTKCLQITMDYIIDEKDLDEYIIQEVSNNLKQDINEFKNHEIFSLWMEEIILDYINNENNPKFDLSDNLIQFYLSKIDLESKKISDSLTEDFLKDHPWLSHFKLDMTENTLKTQIMSYTQLFNRISEKIYEDDIIDLNDIGDIFEISKTFFKMYYLIQDNGLDFNEFFDIGKCYFILDDMFKKILENDIYEQLFEYPYHKKPYTVNNILNHIFRNYKDDRIALILMDGMSYDEWFILKNYLKDFDMIEMSSFAILPTITSFSRTSIFSGKRPNAFINDKKIDKNFERKGFYNYLEEKGLSNENILYGRLDLNGNVISTIKEKRKFNELKGYDCIGLICNLFDELAHKSVIFGNYKSNLYNNIKSAIESTKLIEFINILKEEGYKIILTADHGNIYSEGNDITQYKSLTFEEKSNRCLIFDDEVLADKSVSENKGNCVKFKYNIITNNLFLVLATENQFFGKKGEQTITHGSYMPEEIIVPVVVLG